MTDRPYTLLSCAMSIDGYIDDASDQRLLLSNDTDFDRVDAIRASSDAILVGANTIWRDNPRLMVRSAERREARVAAGQSPSPLKVTVTASGDLSPWLQFFAAGEIDKIVYCTTPATAKAEERLGDAAILVDAGDPIDLRLVLADLSGRGVRRLMVEGGGSLHTQFLAERLADELQLVVAPLFVGDPQAPRFVDDGPFLGAAYGRLNLAEVRQIGDVVLLRYALSHRYPGD